MHGQACILRTFYFVSHTARVILFREEVYPAGSKVSSRDGILRLVIIDVRSQALPPHAQVITLVLCSLLDFPPFRPSSLRSI